jgi:tRNA (guanine26-N2/guanine27-N2)-dimethyltransferase
LLDPLSAECPFSYTEGATKLCGPSPSDVPAMLPAFFNPRGKFVRDVSLVCYTSFGKSSPRSGELSFADALCGIGARGLRVAKEVPSFSSIILNDVNSKALEYAKNSAELNSVGAKCSFSKMEACAFLDSRSDRFDVVDIDPFGTPSPFVESGIRAVRDGGVLSLAATDSAVLCGVYPKVAERKYGGNSIRTDYAHEVGLRLIYGLVAQSAMRLETGIEPLFSHHDMHYFRVYCKVRVGNSFSRKNQELIGFVAHCFRCGYRNVVSRDEFFTRVKKNKVDEKQNNLNVGNVICPSCSDRLSFAGPLWVGNIQSKEFVDDCRRISAIPIFQVEELDIPLYFDLTVLSGKARSRTPKIVDVMRRLEQNGYVTSRTRLNPNALRTGAPSEVLRSIVSELAR